MATHIIYKIPSIIYSGLCAGIVLKLLLPNEDDFTRGYGGRLNRKYFIFGGICMATWLAYVRGEK